VRQATSLPTTDPPLKSTSSVILRRPAPRSSVTPRPGSVGRLNPPPSATSSRRHVRGDLIKFEDDDSSSVAPSSRDSGDWKSSGSFYDELESILLTADDGQNRTSGQKKAQCLKLGTLVRTIDDRDRS
jgi:hypothetical protein